jgi:myo-inositol-1(or 4)-monophosphatase
MGKMGKQEHDPEELEALVATAVEAAEAGAAVLRRYFRGTDLEVRLKGAHDFVTKADKESEAAILAILLGRYPDHHVLAEESGASHEAGPGDDVCQWIIDPLDGTSNFLHGLPVFCVSIGCRRGGELLAGVILDPMGDNLFTACKGGGAWWNGRRMKVGGNPGLPSAFLATGYPFRVRAALDLYLDIFRDIFLQCRGIRRCGAAALDLAYTAAGVYDGFFELRLSPWDFAAGVLLVEEAGGVVTDYDGGQGYFQGGNILAGNPGVHAGLLETVSRHASESKITRIMGDGGA